MIAYNESNALSGLFRDIALQDYPHDKIEVVFVDSMSTDDTKEKMEKFHCQQKQAIEQCREYFIRQME